MKTKFFRALNVLSSIPLFIAFQYIVYFSTRKYTAVGPVANGMPRFENFWDYIWYSRVIVVALLFLYSMYQLRKVHGWIRYCLFVVVTLILPIILIIPEIGFG